MGEPLNDGQEKTLPSLRNGKREMKSLTILSVEMTTQERFKDGKGALLFAIRGSRKNHDSLVRKTLRVIEQEEKITWKEEAFKKDLHDPGLSDDLFVLAWLNPWDPSDGNPGIADVWNGTVGWGDQGVGSYELTSMVEDRSFQGEEHQSLPCRVVDPEAKQDCWVYFKWDQESDSFTWETCPKERDLSKA